MNSESEPESKQSAMSVDLRAELRRNLAAEFKSGLSSTALSNEQQTALGELVKGGTVTPTRILEVLRT